VDSSRTETTMHFFGMLFWLAILWFVFRAIRRRERWAMMGPRGYAPWWYTRDRYDRSREVPAPPRQERGDQQSYIDSLETRVSELEERLDFTERLLASRREAGNESTGPVPS
jgi:hypothetical protein